MIKHIRHVILFLCRKYEGRGEKAKGTTIAREIREVYGNFAIKERTCQKWMKRFKGGDKDEEDVEDKKRSGRPSKFNEDALRQLVEEDPTQTTREMAKSLNTSQMTVVRHLKKMGLVRF